ncbi:MAG: glycosyltransferase family 2 protein [bacterium]
MKKKLISIIIPLLNEEKNIPLVYDALREVWVKLPTYEYEFIFVNDGSTDHSALAIAALAAKDKAVKCIEFSRNFGKEMATTAGIEAATGDAVMMLDADLQHPPLRIPDFVSRWERGAEVVVGMRTHNASDRMVTRVGSKIFHAISGLISETSINKGETDFRLIDRVVVNAFKQLPERERMTRSLINWLGFKKEFVEFEAPARLHGDAKYSTSKLIHLALYSFVSNSLLPLRLAGWLGLCITFLSGLLGIAVFLERYIFNDAFSWHVSGSAQLAIINVFLIGIVLMALGIIALYIGKIHGEVAGRPLYVVRKRMNF